MKWGGDVPQGKVEEERGSAQGEMQRESKRRGRLRSVCLRAAIRHMGWLLGKGMTEGDERKESRKIPEAGRVLTLFCGICHWVTSRRLMYRERALLTGCSKTQAMPNAWTWWHGSHSRAGRVIHSERVKDHVTLLNKSLWSLITFVCLHIGMFLWDCSRQTNKERL